MTKQLAAGMLLAVMIVGCAAEQGSEKYVRDGVQYGVTEDVFRGRWWSYYERGASFLAGEFYDEAMADFSKALDGRTRDSWRARTYGLHFEAFFPNREMGIALFKLGRLDEAETYLARSLEQIDTERAHYYLDEVRRAKIVSGVLQDLDSPVLQTTLLETDWSAFDALPVQTAAQAPEPEVVEAEEPPAAPAAAPLPAPKPQAKPKPKPMTAQKKTVVAERVVPIEVAAKDDVGVSAVSVNGEKLHQRGSEKDIAFEKEVVLDEGTHTLEVAATDLADKETKQEVEVVVDLTGPTIGVFSPIEPTITEYGTVILEGSTVDKNGVSSVTVDSQVVAKSPGEQKLPFNSELPLGAGENTFILAARDVAGNETRSAVKVFKGDPNSVEAKLWLLKEKYPDRLQLAMANPAMLDVLLSAMPEDQGPGQIRIKSPALDKPYHHSRTLRISGEVVARTQIASLSINGQPFEELTGAPKESFNKRIPIAPGELVAGAGTKSVEIIATSVDGEVIKENFQVTVEALELDTPQSRMPVAVLAFNGQGVEQTLAERLRLTTEAQIFSQKRFNVVTRDMLESVLSEQQLSAALGDPSQALEIGKITPAQIFLVADIFQHDKNGLEIKARVVSTETSELIDTIDAFIRDASDPAEVERGCDALAAELRVAFPRLTGSITAVRERGGQQMIMTNLATDDNVRAGTYLVLVYKEADEVDPDTGEVIWPGVEEIVGRARIDRVQDSGSQATVVPVEGEEGIAVEAGMPAVTM